MPYRNIEKRRASQRAYVSRVRHKDRQGTDKIPEKSIPDEKRIDRIDKVIDCRSGEVVKSQSINPMKVGYVRPVE